jgi:hypothetical protein
VAPDSAPELLDYVVFFETEPEWIHPEGWYYGVRFKTYRGKDAVIATLAPDESEFSMEWWQDDLLRVCFRSVMIDSWQIESHDHKELLRLVFNDERVKFCEVQLKPHVRIDWVMTW